MEELPNQEDDITNVRRFYHQLNPDIPGNLDTEVHHESKMFVSSSETGIAGLAIASYLDYGTYPFGIIHELEAAPSPTETQVRQQLARQCMDWLRDRGAVLVTATASDDRERASFEELGFKTSTGEMYRRLPKPMYAARQVS